MGRSGRIPTGERMRKLSLEASGCESLGLDFLNGSGGGRSGDAEAEMNPARQLDF